MKRAPTDQRILRTEEGFFVKKKKSGGLEAGVDKVIKISFAQQHSKLPPPTPTPGAKTKNTKRNKKVMKQNGGKKCCSV